MHEGLTDDESRQLLHLLWRYVQSYTPDLPQTVPALAEDLAMSLDVTRDIDDQRRREIEIAYS